MVPNQAKLWFLSNLELKQMMDKVATQKFKYRNINSIRHWKEIASLIIDYDKSKFDDVIFNWLKDKQRVTNMMKG